MEFKQLKYQLGIRSVFLLFNLIAISWIIVNTDYYAVFTILLLLSVIQIINLWQTITVSIRTLTRFFEALKYEDYSQKFVHRNLGDHFKELSDSLNLVMQRLQSSKHLLAQQSQYLQTILQQVETAMLVFDRAGSVSLMNRAATRLFKKQSLRNINELASHFPQLTGLLKQPNSNQRELCSCLIDNQPHQLLVDKVEARIEQETVYITAIQDIQSELDDKELKAWQEITRVLTHEISNSITPITSLATSCKEMLTEPPDKSDILDLKEAVNTIERRGENLVQFINNYRKLTKIPKLNAQHVRVIPLIEQIKNLFKLDLEKKNIKLTIHTNDQDPIAKIDPVLVEQVLVNLIKNAITALEKQVSPAIDISVDSDKNHLKIVIEDNGKGILADAQTRIFVPFYTTTPCGSGIGLSLSKLIMQLHNGSISVSSELGKGSRFTLVF